MAQPTEYDRIASFTNLQALAPSDPLPGSTVDAEFNAVKATLDEVLTNLALIQRDDGAVANDSIGLDQLTSEVPVGFEVPTVWVAATAYTTANTVFHGSAFYRCLIAHTAGVFATDLAARKWQLIVDLSTIATVSALQVANTPAGNIASTTVQAAINELDSEKAALSHTHLSSAISDSTADGRAFLTATLAAQKVLLGLGSLAYLNAVAVTDINANIGLSGIISPAALASDTNDWAPTGIATASTIRLSASAAINLNGVLAPAAAGAILVLENVGTSFAVTLQPSNTSSAAANRFLIPKPIILGPNQLTVLTYDLTSARWRMLDRASLPRGHIDGLIVSNGTDVTNDLNIAVGECRGTRGLLDMVVTTAIGKELDVDWVAGGTTATPVGGRYVSSANNPAIANTTYHLHLIGKADGTVDAIFYTGIDPTSILPTGYVDYRRIWSGARASATLPAFTQGVDDFVRFTSPARDFNSTTLTNAPQTQNLGSLPTGLALRALLNLSVSNASSGASVYIHSPSDTDSTPVTDLAPLATIRTQSSTFVNVGQAMVVCDTSANITARSDAGSTVFRGVTLGYWDSRGRNL